MIEQWQEYRRTGDIALRNALIEPYIPMARKLAAKYYNNADDAEQDALTGLIAAAESYDPWSGTPFKVWARYKMRYAMIDSFRAQNGARSRFKLVIHTEADMDRAIEDLAPPSGRTPEQDCMRGDIMARCRAAVEALPPHMRRAVCAVYFDGLSRAEAAKELGISVSNVNSSVDQARDKLRYILSDMADAI